MLYRFAVAAFAAFAFSGCGASAVKPEETTCGQRNPASAVVNNTCVLIFNPVEGQEHVTACWASFSTAQTQAQCDAWLEEHRDLIDAPAANYRVQESDAEQDILPCEQCWPGWQN